MPVKPRGSSWQATVHHDGKRARKTFSTKAEAEAWELKAKAALLKGDNIPEVGNAVKEGPATLQELMEATYIRYWKGTPSDKHARLNARKCVEALGPGLPPSSVTEQRIDDMMFSFEAEGLSDSTINRRLSALSKMLTHAFDRGYIARKPKIDRKKEPQHRIRFITESEEEEMLAFFEHCGRSDMKDLVVVGIDTGMRMGEILNAKPQDLSENLISLWKTKSGQSRSIPLTSRAAEVLHRRAHKAPYDAIFEGWTHSKVRHYWDQCRRHMKLLQDPQFVPHTMRHTFCSRLVQRGIDIVTVSKLAGHASIQMTMRYAHLSPDNLAHAIRALEEIKVAGDYNLPSRATPQTCGVSVA